MTADAATAWLRYLKPGPSAVLRLFCFPYAGGSASLFRDWPENFPETIEVCPVQLPGRESRISEKTCDQLESLAAMALDGLSPYLDKPFAIFGSSMGAMLGFELARQLRDQRGPQPKQLFVVAGGAPQIPEPAPLHILSDTELIEELRRYGSIAPELLEHEEFAQLFLPLIRADCRACETYVCSANEPLSCPISVYGGLQDHTIAPERLRAWHAQTTAAFNLQMYPGGHLFINTAKKMLLAAVAQELGRYVAALS